MSFGIGQYSFSLLNIQKRAAALFQAIAPKQYAETVAKDKAIRLKLLAMDIGLSESIKIVDVGANPMDFDAPYKSLLDAGLCDVFGFEPQEYAYDQLLQTQGPQETYVNAAVGDGKSHVFYQSKSGGLSSLFKLDPKAKNVFEFLRNPDGDAYHLTSETPIETRRLDDITEIETIDFLKIDIQCGELAVFQNARTKMQSTVAVQTEMRFCRIYENEPVFGEVDIELNNQGFEMHCLFEGPTRQRMPNSQLGSVSGRVARQLIDDDFIYVRDLRDLDTMEPLKLKKLAILAAGVFDSVDLAIRCIDILEKKQRNTCRGCGRVSQ